MDTLHSDIERRLQTSHPEVELLACQRISAERLRLVIDHAGGVSLALCESVTKALGELLADYGLEVSSPGPERPLTKPEHFRRYIGRRARVRTREPRDGHRSFTGELVEASEDAVVVAAGEGVVSIPFAQISGGNLVPSERGAA